MKIIVVFAALLCGVSQAQTPPPQATGYTLTHSDEFDSLDIGASWTGQTHQWYTSEYGQVITPSSSQASVASSVLSLDWHPGMTRPAEASLSSFDMGSQKGMAYRYGYYEARMKWSPVAGAWPGFWLLSLQSAITTGEWGEIDIFEGLGNLPYDYFGTVHDWTALNGTRTSTFNPGNDYKLLTSVDYSQWHKYGVLWEPGTLTWYFDDQPIIAAPAPAITDAQDVELILSSSEGVNWAQGNTSGVTSTDLSLNVDWVRVWQKNPVTVILPNGGTASRGTAIAGDITAPSVPANLSAVVSPSGVSLTWSPSTDNVGVKAYDVYRNGGYLNYSFTSTYTDVAAAGVWTYQVLAYDAAGNYSALSAPLQVTVAIPQTIIFPQPGNETLGALPFIISAKASSGLAVSLTSNTLPVCTVSANTVTLIIAGTCSVTATQAGNATYSAAVPVPQIFTVFPRSQTITFVQPNSPTVGAMPSLLTATASSGLAVTFTSNTPSICTVSGNTVTPIAAGNCSIMATQAGNAIYAAAVPVPQIFTVFPRSQTITFVQPNSPTVGAMPSLLTATASSGLAVTFTSNTPSVCTVSGNTVTPIAAGNCSIMATQNGNANYSASASVTQIFTVFPESQTITFGSIATQGLGTTPLTLTATATSGGALSFYSGAPSVCSVAGNVVTLIATGTCLITASQAGGGSYAAASPVTQSFSVRANLLTNGGFEYRLLSPWQLFVTADGQASASDNLDTAVFADGKASWHIAVNSAATTDWHIDFEQANISLTAGKTYQLQFWARTDSPRQLEVVTQGTQASNWAYYGLYATLPLGSSWTRSSVTFVAFLYGKRWAAGVGWATEQEASGSTTSDCRSEQGQVTPVLIDVTPDSAESRQTIDIRAPNRSVRFCDRQLASISLARNNQAKATRSPDDTAHPESEPETRAALGCGAEGRRDLKTASRWHGQSRDRATGFSSGLRRSAAFWPDI